MRSPLPRALPAGWHTLAVILCTFKIRCTFAMRTENHSTQLKIDRNILTQSITLLNFFYTVFQPFRNISWQHLDKAENVNNLHDRLTLILIISTQFPSFSCLVDNFKHWMQVLAFCHTGFVCKIIYSYLVVFLSVWEICLLYKPNKSVIDFVHGR